MTTGKMKSYFRGAVILLSLLLGVDSVPKQGNYQGLRIYVDGNNVGYHSNSSCSSIAMLSRSPIRVSLQAIDLPSVEDFHASVEIKTELYESQCETMDKKDCYNQQLQLLAENFQELEIDHSTSKCYFQMKNTRYIYKSAKKPDVTKPDESKPDNSEKHNKTRRATTAPVNGTEEPPKTMGTAPPTNATDTSQNVMVKTKPNWQTFTTNSSGIYVVLISINNFKKVKGTFNLTFNVEMKNSYGYISLVDYPALITYGLLLVVYVFYAFLWLILMACNYKELVRLQFWILAVVLLGFLEKIFFVAEYGSANEGHGSAGLIYVAEGVSAGKRALARILLVIVCEGFGTVKPRLGSTLTKVLVVGGIYFVAAFIDGIARASKMTASGFDPTSTVTSVLLFLIDIGVVYWIFSALVNTRRALRVRKNVVKLSLYNHLSYALIATVIASLAFTIWEFIAIAREDCTADWREMWLTDCFWHMLFCFVLLVVMIIWRPSANSLRYAYTQVSLESDEEREQGANKNFETLKMRTISKDGPKPVLMSQEAEDDLKWAEENLPTTIIDKTLPVILDSEEEVMTTKYESSKMN